MVAFQVTKLKEILSKHFAEEQETRAIVFASDRFAVEQLVEELSSMSG